MIGEVIIILVFSIFLMFYWEKRIRFWLRLPIINLVLLVVLLIGVVIQEFYLTAYPEKRTKWVRSSILQLFFLP